MMEMPEEGNGRKRTPGSERMDDTQTVQTVVVVVVVMVVVMVVVVVGG